MSSENHLTHSRNLSQDSATSYRSVDISLSKQSQDSVSMNFLHDNPPSTRPTSRETCDEINLIQELEPCYETNSLPRQKCIHHKPEFHTYSLPRPDNHHHHHHSHMHHDQQSTVHDAQRSRTESVEMHLGKTILKRASISRESSTDSNQRHELAARRYSHGTYENIAAYKRPIYPTTSTDSGGPPLTHTLARRRLSYQQSRNVPSEELCSTCESESDSKEKEIFIDFKPRISPVPSPRSKKKRLQKTLSEGEILFDKRREMGDGMPMASASEEELKSSDALAKGNKGSYFYSNVPIKDEGIFDTKHLLKLPGNGGLRNKREAFRKRSISLEDPALDTIIGSVPIAGENAENTSEPVQNGQVIEKSAPPSPCPDELSAKGYSTFPSTDSLANDLTRDISDGIWNESQATVLQAEPRYDLVTFLNFDENYLNYV